MYKVASDRRQRALHQGRPTDWVNGEEKQSPEDKRRNLQAAMQNLEERIKALPPGSAERRELGRQKLEWQQELRILGKLAKAKNIEQQTLERAFMEIAREQLPPAHFRAMMAGAERLHDQWLTEAKALRDRAQQIVDGVDAEQKFHR